SSSWREITEIEAGACLSSCSKPEAVTTTSDKVAPAATSAWASARLAQALSAAPAVRRNAKEGRVCRRVEADGAMIRYPLKRKEVRSAGAGQQEGEGCCKRL